MTPDEVAEIQSALTAGETELAGLRQLERDYIDKAREFNAATRETRNKATALERSLAPVRAKVAEHNAEQRRLAAEAAAAAKVQEQSELEKVRQERDELKAALAAKG